LSIHISVYDHGGRRFGAYIVGPTWLAQSRRRTFATVDTQVIRIASQVGSALSYAHRQGVVHRDVKPANILLDSDGNAYLADFGIAARAVEAITGIQSKSIGYRAPEDHDGGAVDPRAVNR
jgi:serine/threonine protein kinase